MPADPSRTGYTFDGWWTKDGSDGIWDTQFTKDTIVAILPNPMSVYAKWVADGGGGEGNINISVTVTYSTDTQLAFTYTSVPVNQDTPQDITITIGNAAAFPGAAFNWYYTKNNTLLGSGASYTVPFSSPSTDIDYLIPGKHTFMVEAVIGGYAQHSGWVEIEVKVVP
jgi:uncharacterized repeat protein (TIGR02543 family)